jgi:hypothetical protein
VRVALGDLPNRGQNKKLQAECHHTDDDEVEQHLQKLAPPRFWFPNQPEIQRVKEGGAITPQGDQRNPVRDLKWKCARLVGNNFQRTNDEDISQQVEQPLAPQIGSEKEAPARSTGLVSGFGEPPTQGMRADMLMVSNSRAKQFPQVFQDSSDLPIRRRKEFRQLRSI